MKQLSLLTILLFLVGCSSQPSRNNIQDVTDNNAAFADAPELEQEMEEPVAKADREEPPPPAAPPTSSQYSALNEAIKAQNDERIYQAATQILTQSPNDPKALNALAMYHYKRSRFQLSQYLLVKAIGANGRMAELHSNLGIVHLAQGEQKEALNAFRKAMSIDNDEPVAASNLGAIYVAHKDYGKAQVVLETAYRKGVRDIRVLNNYAVALTAHRKYDRAEDLYKTVLKENASSKEALYNYAILLIDHMGKFKDGLEVISRLKFVGGPAETRNQIIGLENRAKAGLK